MASQEVGHSTWFRSCIPIISVKLFVCGAGFIGICRSGRGRPKAQLSRRCLLKKDKLRRENEQLRAENAY